MASRGDSGLSPRRSAGLRRLLLGAVTKRQRSRAARRERARAAAGDGVRSLLGAVLLALPPGDPHVILVTSAARGQGSARVVASLARALAQTGQETLAVSADPSSSELAAAFGVAPSPGLTEALKRAHEGSAVRLRAATVPGLDTLRVVPAGAAADGATCRARTSRGGRRAVRRPGPHRLQLCDRRCPRAAHLA